MNEPAEIVGSMPSVPQQEPHRQLPQQKRQGDNLSNFIGYFLCIICLLVFPSYAHTDDLGTGIFYGMGSFLLLLVTIGFCSRIIKRVGKNRPPKASGVRSHVRGSRQRWRLNGILVGIFFLLLSMYLLTAPDVLNLGDLVPLGLITLLIGIGVTFIALVGRPRDNRVTAAEEAKLGPGNQEQNRRSNSIKGSVVIFAFGLFLLAFPQMVSVNAFTRGIFDGIGLLVLLITIIGLNSIVFSRKPGAASAG